MASQPGCLLNRPSHKTQYETSTSTKARRVHAPLSHAFRIIQFLPEDPGVVPANLVRFLVDVEVAGDVVAIGAVVRDQDFDLLRSDLLHVSGVFPDGFAGTVSFFFFFFFLCVDRMMS
jgi:hypothetical protein